MDERYGILIVSVTILVLGFLGTASATNWTVDGSGGADFTGIQEAINNAKDGDTILVYSGVYYENVVVNKSVILKGIDYPVVDAGGERMTYYTDAIKLTADGITLAGFTATNASYPSIIFTQRVLGCFPAGILVNSNNNNITGNNVSNNKGGGICLYDSCNNNNITGNNVSNNSCHGISLWDSCNNNITGNNIGNNGRHSIKLYYSSNDNIIYFNNVINNTDNVDYVGSTNIWNSTEEITYTYNGTTYKSYVGNYWDNYEGTDADGDGIGNTPYSINSEKEESDDYPLMKPFENYIELVVGEHFL